MATNHGRLMADVPEPLTPFDCDLRDFAFMPLDVVRLRDSGLSASASSNEFRAAVLLWCASWHQVPAASLPDDDKALAHLAGYGRDLREWRKVREGAMRLWVRCSDGRLYHPVVAEKAVESWEKRKKQRAKAMKRWGQTPETESNGSAAADATAYPTASQRHVPPHGTRQCKGQGQGQGQGENTPKPPQAGDGRTAKSDSVPGFDRFWAAYPGRRKVDKKTCLKTWIREGLEGIADAILAGLERWKTTPEWTKQAGQFVCAPLVFLNQTRWEASTDDAPADAEFVTRYPTDEELAAMEEA